MQAKGKVLVIEDEETIQRIIRDYLTSSGYDVRCVADGLEGVQLFDHYQPDLLILDLNLPSMSGLEVAAHIRKRSAVYIIMVTARSEEDDQIIGLQSGADDYVTKPFSPRTLVARVDAAMRRHRESAISSDQLLFAHIRIDSSAREAWVAQTALALTFTEFNLLVELASHAGLVLSRQQLLDRVWGADYAGNDRVVDVYVGQVRRKIEEATDGISLIQTVRGAGYKFVDEKV